ncbi:uncharacterized protein N7458_002541 [Penicillium daleae]|uniref:MADS-box domain-containing protein n=1 Tax=Penicillium daleae TaxID=63821 RepID=A0AAD6G5Z6_9EURO|nr:uncharacterized protein N7458_002541 [Penicillium daleae]KAJ5460989.1 hypothetical protein N7458_002541 [Penicillium daleae]
MTRSKIHVKQEQLRKRRKNLLRRHNDFWRLYSIKSWVVMEMPNGRVYSYRSHPELPPPSVDYSTNQSQPTNHKTPADYDQSMQLSAEMKKALSEALKTQDAIQRLTDTEKELCYIYPFIYNGTVQEHLMVNVL